MSVVRTVLDDIDPGELGFTHTHEHLMCDLSRRLSVRASATERARNLEPITLANYYKVRREHSSESMRLLSVDDAVEELGHYTHHGGRSVVEATSIGLGRDPAALAHIARVSGVNIVMGSGYYVRDYQPPDLDDRSEAELTAEIVADITVGVGDTGIRSGIVGEIGMSWPAHPTEEKVLRAAAAAQRETGAAMLVHPGRGTAAPSAHLDAIVAAGGDAARTIISHIDRTLFELDSMRALADRGCVLEFDLFGQESSHYPLAPIDMPNDATRVDYLAALIAAGHGDRLLIAQDICRKAHLRKYGGEGYSHILEHVLPLMRRKGLSEPNISALTVDNPARLLAIPDTV